LKLDVAEDANISWTEKVTNEEVLAHANKARSILKTIWHKQYRWLGHVLRHDIIEGKMLGKATQSRKRMELLHDMMGRKRLWTVERCNLSQVKMETG